MVVRYGICFEGLGMECVCLVILVYDWEDMNWYIRFESDVVRVVICNYEILLIEGGYLVKCCYKY